MRYVFGSNAAIDRALMNDPAFTKSEDLCVLERYFTVSEDIPTEYIHRVIGAADAGPNAFYFIEDNLYFLKYAVDGTADSRFEAWQEMGRDPKLHKFLTIGGG